MCQHLTASTKLHQCKGRAVWLEGMEIITDVSNILMTVFENPLDWVGKKILCKRAVRLERKCFFFLYFFLKTRLPLEGSCCHWPRYRWQKTSSWVWHWQSHVKVIPFSQQRSFIQKAPTESVCYAEAESQQWATLYLARSDGARLLATKAAENSLQVSTSTGTFGPR